MLISTVTAAKITQIGIDGIALISDHLAQPFAGYNTFIGNNDNRFARFWVIG